MCCCRFACGMWTIRRRTKLLSNIAVPVAWRFLLLLQRTAAMERWLLLVCPGWFDRSGFILNWFMLLVYFGVCGSSWHFVVQAVVRVRFRSGQARHRLAGLSMYVAETVVLVRRYALLFALVWLYIVCPVVCSCTEHLKEKFTIQPACVSLEITWRCCSGVAMIHYEVCPLYRLTVFVVTYICWSSSLLL